MAKNLFLLLAIVLGLSACGMIPEAQRTALSHKFDWSGEGIRATLEYRTVQAPPSKTTCAGSLRIENYGSKSYSVLLFKVNVYSGTKELIATDTDAPFQSRPLQLTG